MPEAAALRELADLGFSTIVVHHKAKRTQSQAFAREIAQEGDRLEAVARHCGKVLIVHEDSRTGGIGESLAAVLQEQAFESLDAPIRILGALDAPVPYSPPLEDAFLPSAEQVERAARLLADY